LIAISASEILSLRLVLKMTANLTLKANINIFAESGSKLIIPVGSFPSHLYLKIKKPEE
jgi:hypothetical protein